MDQQTGPTGDRITLGVSSCLLGEAVRHDGRHKSNSLILGTLSRQFAFHSCCPEVEIGLGTPRPPIRLVATADGTRALGVADPHRDVTDALAVHAERMARKLGHISGYIFKRGSPSCGLSAVPLVSEQGEPAGSGGGIFASALTARMPGLPVDDEQRLEDAALRANFIERVLVYHRWQLLLAAGLSHRGLIDFHTRHKFSLLAHSEAIYRQLGPLVAEAGARGIERAGAEYFDLLMEAMAIPATAAGHANALLHIFGFIKHDMEQRQRTALLDEIERLRRGRSELESPLASIRRHLEHFPDDYLARQYYLYPAMDWYGQPRRRDSQ